MFCGHIDTVGVEGMARPFDPVVRDGRLYGRGAQDMKGGVAAMIDAARVVAAEGLPTGRLIVAAVVDEEYASIGADALVTRWRADAAVVTEPTDLQIAIGHKGFAWVEVETRGTRAHGSRPREGRDAILRMGRVLHALEALDRDLQQRAPHPLMGAASLHASLIEGGRELSSYPDRCALQLERRTIGGETDESTEQRVDAHPRRPAAVRCRVRRVVALAVLAPVLRDCGGACAAAGVVPRRRSLWNDGATHRHELLDGRGGAREAGTPSVLFGPGGAGLHSVEEYVRLADVLACRDALVALVREWQTQAQGS